MSSSSIALSIAGATVAAWVIGMLWYSPLLFGKAWAKAYGYTAEDLAAMRATAGRTYGGSLVALAVTAGVLRIFLAHLGADSLHDGAGWGFHAWLGFAFPIGFTNYLFSKKPVATFLIDTGYQLVYLAVMGAILGAWM